MDPTATVDVIKIRGTGRLGEPLGDQLLSDPDFNSIMPDSGAILIARGDTKRSTSSGIHKLHGEVLLEVFDFYRRDIKHGYYPTPLILCPLSPHDEDSRVVPLYESRWNNKRGWFRLAHVCQNWRSIVFASSSRLDLSFVLRDISPCHMKVLLSPRLPSFPIIIDYPHGASRNTDLNRVVIALKYCDRVRGVVFKGPNTHLKKLFNSMDRPFPALERLEVSSSMHADLNLPTTFLRGSAPRLRRLKLHFTSLGSVSKLLSSATGLVDLSLSLMNDNSSDISSTETLLACLQAMPCLHHLVLKLNREYNVSDAPNKTKDIVTLSNLSFFHFTGHRAFFEAVVVGLEAPSLRAFDLVFSDNTVSPLCHLTRFITGAETPNHALQVVLSSYCNLSLFSHSEHIDYTEPRFKFHSLDIIQISTALSPKLAAVEELVVCCDHLLPRSAPWHSFFQLFHSVKILRLESFVMRHITHALRPDESGEPTLDLLPSLEEIQVRLKDSDGIDEARRKLEQDALRPIAVARQRAGRSIKLSWVWVEELSRRVYESRVSF